MGNQNPAPYALPPFQETEMVAATSMPSLGLPPYAYISISPSSPGVPPYAHAPHAHSWMPDQLAMAMHQRSGVSPYFRAAPYSHTAPAPYSHTAPAPYSHAAPYAHGAMMPYAHAFPSTRQPPGRPPYFSGSQWMSQAPSPPTSDLQAATDPTLSSGLGWSLWRFNGQTWECVSDQSHEGARASKPDDVLGKFVGQMVRTPSVYYDRDDGALRTDVKHDPHQINEIIRRAMDIPGYGSEEEIRWIVGTAANLRPGDIWVEVGALCGRSFLAAGLSLPAGATLITVDRSLGQTVRRGHTLFETYHELVQSRWDLSVVMTRTTSPDAASLFRNQLCQVVFLDGDHQAAAVRNDIAAWKPRLAPGGMICGHDYGEPNYPGLTQTVNELPGSSVAVGSIWVWHP